MGNENEATETEEKPLPFGAGDGPRSPEESAKDDRVAQWSETIGPRICEAVAEDLPEELTGFVHGMSKRAIECTLYNLEDIGFCSIRQHVVAAEFMDDGRCDECAKSRAHHRVVFVCDEPVRGPRLFDDPAEPLPDGPCVQCAARAADLDRREAELADLSAPICEQYGELRARLTESIHRRVLVLMAGRKDWEAPQAGARELMATPGGAIPVDEWRRDLAFWAGAGTVAGADLLVLLERLARLLEIVDPSQKQRAKRA